MNKILRYSFVVLLTMIMGVANAAQKGTITFNASNVKINAVNVTGVDDLGNSWTITTEGTTSFTSNSAYYQVGKAAAPATSITFTTTLPQEVNITSMEAKFGGFSGTAGTVILKVGETSVGTGALNASTDVTVSSSKEASGTVLTVTVTDIAKGVKCYYISYTYDDGDNRSDTSIEFSDGYQTQIGGGPDGKFPQIGQSVALPTATVKAGNAVVEGATVDWSLTMKSWKPKKEDELPTIADGKISFDGRGVIEVTATYAENDTYKGSTKSYTLTVYNSYGLLSEMVNDIADPNFEKSDESDGDGSLTFYFFRNIDADGIPPVQNTVTYVNGKYIYLTDGEKNLLFYGTNSQELKAGDVISGNVNDTNLGGFWGALKRRYKLPQFSFTDMNVKVESTGAAPDPKTITADQLKDNINAYVKIENAVFKSATGKTFTFTVGETEFTVYNQWSVADQSKDDKKLVETATYTLTGMGSVYKSGTADAVYQLYLAGFEMTAPASVNAIKTNGQFQGKMYNTAGQVVNKGYKGLVIQDGRKYVNK